MPTHDADELMEGPLVAWVRSRLKNPDALETYTDLVDGVLLHSVFTQIHAIPLSNRVVPSGGSTNIRTKNLKTIMGNIRHYYEETLGQVVIKAPNLDGIGRHPENFVSDMELFLTLLLGCAVGSPEKLAFITDIKELLPIEIQMSIVPFISMITDKHEIVINHDVLAAYSLPQIFPEIRRIINERNTFREKLQHITDEFANLDEQCPSSADSSLSPNFAPRSKNYEQHHYAVELADWKSRVRKQRQELEEKTEALLEYKDELEQHRQAVNKLRLENLDLAHEARNAKMYRDEVDALTERAERADRLEIEIARYREKLTDIDFYKSRITELREDNRVLMENREMLEEQLNSSRRRAEKVLELEGKIIEYQQKLNDMALERAADKEKYEELYDENLQLRQLKKAADEQLARNSYMSDSEEPILEESTLSEQLSNHAQTRALKLELENRRLTTLLDSMKENAFHESSGRVLELEKDKKKLSLKLDSLTDNNERLNQANADLELVCKQALEENKKLQDALKHQRSSLERQQQDYQAQQEKILDLEKSYEAAIKEKQRVQTLVDSIQRRADEVERSLENANQKLEEMQELAQEHKELTSKCTDFEFQIATLEKDKETALRDVHKCRETIEEKDVALDKMTNQINILTKKIEALESELQSSVSQIARLQEIERSSKEMDTRAAIDKETLETLQSNLIAEKLASQQLQAGLEKLGLTMESLLSLSAENIVEQMLNVPEMMQYINKLIANIENQHNSFEFSESQDHDAEENESLNKDLQEKIESLQRELESSQVKLTASQATAESLLEEQAKLQVSVTTLESKITSLNAQHTALQLANSQLAAEKDELIKEREALQLEQEELIKDQITLQKLHDSLNIEYEKIIEEREETKIALRDTKFQYRALKEEFRVLEVSNEHIAEEREASAENLRTLTNLRCEHSKLKDDFRNLYTAAEKLKSEYRNQLEEYRKNKIETNRLSLKVTELQGELSFKDEHCSNLEIQFNTLSQRCDMLVEMNNSLTDNRRSLMSHVSALMNQYQDLLLHTLDDRDYYHREEKQYRDKVNQLFRQKEKLEEKIMEYYKNKKSCSTKKKGFGASLVERVRQAGSDLLNMNRQSWTDDSKHSDAKLDESESGTDDSDASAGSPISIEGGIDLLDITPVCLEDESLSLGTPGTRRTVYYTADPPSPTTSLPVQNDSP